MFKLVVLLSVAALAAAKPSAVVAPVAYSAVVPGVSSYSQYSTSVLHGSPVVGPAVYSSPVVGPAVYSSPVVSSVIAPAVVPALGALSQAPNSPAVVLDAVNGVPLDTPEVVAARAAHYTAKALSGYHHLRKRSVAAIAPVAYSTVAHTSPVVSAYSAPLVSAYSAPLVSAYSTPVVASPYSAVYPRALSYHPY